MTTPNTTPARIEREARLMWVALADIYINPEAQREYRHSWAAQIAAEFDPDSFKPPVLSKRGGKYYCVDGQHTIGAFRLMGWEDQQVQCWVYEGKTEAEEADLFLKLNNAKAIQAFDKFRIGVNAERPEETDIDRIVRAQGLNVSREAEGVGAVTALRKVYSHGGATLGRTLRIIRDAYGVPGMQSEVIEGVGLVCARYNGEVNDAEAVAKLARLHGGVDGLLGKARVSRKQLQKPLTQCVAATVVEVINSGKGGKKLPNWWKQ